MKSTMFTLNWRDALKALAMAVLTTFIFTLAQSCGIDMANGTIGVGGFHFPTHAEFILALKAAIGVVVVYLCKNFFTNDIPAAQKTLADARLKDPNA